MKKHISAILLTLSTLTIGTVYPAIMPLKFMDWNIRRDGDEKDPKNLWKNRKNSVINHIKEEKPAIICLQEVVEGQQSKDLENGLESSGYRFFGKNRSETMTGWLHYFVMKHPRAKKERNPIGYDTNKVKLITSGDFGINPGYSIFTPWLPRNCSYGQFEDIQQKTHFIVYNTHLDNESDYYRNEQMKIILKHAAKNAANLPVIITGDLNTKIKGDIKQELDKSGFVQARDIATIVKGPRETRTGWNNSELKEIDHILARNAKVKEHKVIESPKGEYESDHRPLCAEIIF
jgi:endonuclease/exonuclease/phosphatase family metal-dependent hydrolase